MPFHGIIVTHEQDSNVGLIRPHNSAQGVFFLVGDIKNKPEGDLKLVGREASFEVVQTDKGPMAMNIE